MKPSRTLPLLFVLVLLSLMSCGYYAGDGSLSQQYETITIPYAKNDLDGFLTKELTKVFATDSDLRVENCEADLILNVELLNIDEENIGFRYDRNKRGELIHEVIPVETRLIARAIVSLVDASSGCLVVQPIVIEATYDFDHDYNSPLNSVNIFSLGQLTDYDEAYDAAVKPLYHNLARKICDYVSDVW